MTDKIADKSKIVLFRTQGNLMMAMVEDGDLLGLASKNKFIKLMAPRVIVVSGNPGEQMQLTLVPFGVMSSKTFLNEKATNNQYYTLFNSDMIEAEIPKEFLSNTIINHYVGTLITQEVPTLTKEDIPGLKDVDMSNFKDSINKETKK